MPIRKPCISCGQLIPRTLTRCANCQQSYEAKRGTTAQRGYDHQWQQTRTIILERDNHQCQIRTPHICTIKATTVDHINPLANGGERLDHHNLQAACKPCNSGKRDRINENLQTQRNPPETHEASQTYFA